MFEDTSYGEGFTDIWDSERRVCLPEHFDTYFRMSLSDETISSTDLSEVITRADDQAFIQERLRHARNQLRKNGKSVVPIILDELTTHAKEIDRKKVQNFLCALFAIVDDITRKEDGERGFSFVTTYVRVHWLIRRITEGRFSLEEKSALYLMASEAATLGWLVDFVSSAMNDYRPREDHTVDLSTCLVTEEAIPTLKNRALSALREAAKRGALLRESDLMDHVYSWRGLSDDGERKRRNGLDTP